MFYGVSHLASWTFWVKSSLWQCTCLQVIALLWERWNCKTLFPTEGTEEWLQWYSVHSKYLGWIYLSNVCIEGHHRQMELFLPCFSSDRSPCMLGFQWIKPRFRNRVLFKHSIFISLDIGFVVQISHLIKLDGFQTSQLSSPCGLFPPMCSVVRNIYIRHQSNFCWAEDITQWCEALT